jgi:signal transduction histidine kinase
MSIPKQCLIVFVTILAVLPAAGQNQLARARLLKEVAGNIPDSSRARKLAELCFSYLNSNADSAMMFAQEGLALSQKINFAGAEFENLSGMAAVYSLTGNPDKSLQSLTSAIQIAKKQNMQRQLAFAAGNMGSLYAEAGDPELSASYYREAIAAFERANDKQSAAIFLVYLGQVYINMKKPDSALIFLRQGLSRADSIGQQDVVAEGYSGIGDIYLQKRDTLSAIPWYRKAIPLALAAKGDNIAGSSILQLAVIYAAATANDSALVLGRQAFVISQTTGFLRLVSQSAGFLAGQFAKLNRKDSAYHYLLEQKLADDSLYSQEKLKSVRDIQFSEKLRQQESVAQQDAYNNRLKLYALVAVLLVFAIVLAMLWRNIRTRKRAYELLQQQKSEIEIQREKANTALAELKSAQSQLIQAEKMASLGELTAGIAHEIQNPLNFVNNFSEVSVELIEEMQAAINQNDTITVKEIAGDIRANLEKIAFHGKRADGIVKGMLQHSRTAATAKEPADINKLADEYLRLSYHGLRAKERDFSADYETNLSEGLPMVKVVPQEIGRVLLNLFNNAFYSVNQKSKTAAAGYRPTVIVSTTREGNLAIIRVRDNGLGVPIGIREKVLQPFYTTKPTGQGTGLGLSISYDIVKAHGGNLRLQSEEGEMAEFIVTLPIE